MSDDINYFATSIIASLTAFSLYKVCRTQSQASKNQKLINDISAIPIKSADDTFTNGQTVIVKGTVARNTKDGRNDTIFRQNVDGLREEYIIYVKYKQSIFSNENFTNKEQYVINLKELLGKANISINPSFLLKGLRNSVTVSGYDQSDFSPMLEITRWDNKRRRLTISEKLQVLMLTYFRALGTLVIPQRNRPGYLRGIDIGTREVQTGLKVGASVLALGTIGVNLNGQVFMEPHLLFKDRLTIIANLTDVVSSYEDSRNFWLVVFLLGAVYVGRRIYKYNKKNDLISKIKRLWNKEDSYDRKLQRKY